MKKHEPRRVLPPELAQAGVPFLYGGTVIGLTALIKWLFS